ncbi:MAG: hypothetical protein J6X44_06510 [Thermoguttaceae bacterium]|nr:hypothetical protein [Thermoguttaceae bacterium]
MTTPDLKNSNKHFRKTLRAARDVDRLANLRARSADNHFSEFVKILRLLDERGSSRVSKEIDGSRSGELATEKYKKANLSAP